MYETSFIEVATFVKGVLPENICWKARAVIVWGFSMGTRYIHYVHC